MKKRGKGLIVFLVCLFAASGAWAQCVATKQYANPDRETWINHVTDSMSSLGKNPQQAAQIKRQRQILRRSKRQKSINAARHQAMQACLKRQRQQITQADMP